MKRGPKAQPPSVKKLRGTFQAYRDSDKVEIEVPDSLPKRPDWLTTAGEEIWMDEIGRVGTTKRVTELDSTMFANYCNLQGAIVMAFRAGAVPPAAYLSEARKMAEAFGIYTDLSRIKTAAGTGGGQHKNPFDAF